MARATWPRAKGAKAATEFQKILDHRGIVFSDPVGAAAHLQLGRAFAIEAGLSRHGKNGGVKPPLRPDALAKAKTADQDFLTLWKDADPDIPMLKQAKAEYAKLEATVALATTIPGNRRPRHACLAKPHLMMGFKTLEWRLPD